MVHGEARSGKFENAAVTVNRHMAQGQVQSAPDLNIS